MQHASITDRLYIKLVQSHNSDERAVSLLSYHSSIAPRGSAAQPGTAGIARLSTGGSADCQGGEGTEGEDAQLPREWEGVGRYFEVNADRCNVIGIFFRVWKVSSSSRRWETVPSPTCTKPSTGPVGRRLPVSSGVLTFIEGGCFLIGTLRITVKVVRKYELNATQVSQGPFHTSSSFESGPPAGSPGKSILGEETWASRKCAFASYLFLPRVLSHLPDS